MENYSGPQCRHRQEAAETKQARRRVDGTGWMLKVKPNTDCSTSNVLHELNFTHVQLFFCARLQLDVKGGRSQEVAVELLSQSELLLSSSAGRHPTACGETLLFALLRLSKEKEEQKKGKKEKNTFLYPRFLIHFWIKRRKEKFREESFHILRNYISYIYIYIESVQSTSPA